MDKRKITKMEMLDLEEALNDFLEEAPSGFAGMPSLLTKDKETKTMLFGDDDNIEVLLIALIQYAADKQEINVFEKILNMQLTLMRFEPETYEVYAKKLNAMNKEGKFD